MWKLGENIVWTTAFLFWWYPYIDTFGNILFHMIYPGRFLHIHSQCGIPTMVPDLLIRNSPLKHMLLTNLNTTVQYLSSSWHLELSDVPRRSNNILCCWYPYHLPSASRRCQHRSRFQRSLPHHNTSHQHLTPVLHFLL